MKLFTYACILFITSFTNINAQFAGYYSLRDGGPDAQSSTLFVLPDHTFIIVSMGVNPMKGNWIEESKNKIKLERNTADNSIFSVYAISDSRSENNIQFSPLEQLNLYVSFSKNPAKETIYQPLFDEDWSCIDRNFETKIPNKSTLLRLVSPVNTVDFSKDAVYPVSSDVYTFNLLQKQSSYRVFIDGNEKKPLQFEIEKHNDDYKIQQSGGYNSIETERHNITDKMMDKMKDALVPWQINDLIRKGFNVELLQPIKVEKMELNKPTEKPLFVSKCQ